MTKEQIQLNRTKFLNELRYGPYKKGTIRSDNKGKPIIESKEDDEGSCACAVMVHLFDPLSTSSTYKSRKALGITGQQCYYIHNELNDSPLTFPQIADRIEKEIFNR